MLVNRNGVVMLKTNLRVLRKNSGLTQTEIAEAAGITTTCYQRYESGERIPRLDVAIKIADALGVTVYDIYAE